MLFCRKKMKMTLFYYIFVLKVAIIQVVIIFSLNIKGFK